MSFSRARGTHSRGDVARKLVEIERLQRRRRVGIGAGKREKLVDQMRGAIGAGDDLPHRVLQVHRIALSHRDLRLHL